MKAIISTTYDDKYLYFLPIVTWCWNRLGVDVICFMPELGNNDLAKPALIIDTMGEQGLRFQIETFVSPEHKEATYAQCSRLFAGCLDIENVEAIITSDVDMAFFSSDLVSQFKHVYSPIIFGHDLVPEGQYPMCYAVMMAKDWRLITRCEDGRTYQQCLDDELGGIEAEHFRGNFWSRDQELLFKKLNRTMQVSYPAPIPKQLWARARPGTQFATHRVDRDDFYWRERVTPDLVDAHLWRPGFEPANFANIMELLQMMYPTDDFSWLFTYTEAYKKLL